MIELCGEWVCGPYDDFPMMVGAQNGARLIILEHRFYGESQPMPDWSMESLQYLSSEMAMADIAYFIGSMNGDMPER